jgi:hypothetical protein
MDQDKMEWLGLDWLTEGPVEGSCEYGNESSVSYNVGKFSSNCIIGGFSKSAQLHVVVIVTKK